MVSATLSDREEARTDFIPSFGFEMREIITL